MSNTYYPVRMRVIYTRLAKKQWVCLVRDFFGSVVFSLKGKSRESIRPHCCKAKNQLWAIEKVAQRNARVLKGEKWKSGLADIRRTRFRK